MNIRKALLATMALVLVVMMFPALTVDAGGPKGPSIVDVAIAVNSDGPYKGSFDTLIAAVSASPTALAALSGNGQYTVFAPTDDAFNAAFAALGITAGDLLANEALLTEILLYHVARGRRDAADVLDSSRIRTVQGGFLMQNGGVLTDAVGRQANIIVTDVPAANGIIHAIDAVVLPYLP
jgi:transforming growth factor-beta-induced protein